MIEAPEWLDSEASEIERLPVRIDRYGKARERAVDTLEYIEAHNEGSKPLGLLAVKLRQCGNYLVFRNYHSVGQVRLHAASFCKVHLVCPLCAIRRGSKALSAYLERFEYIRSEKSALRPFLVTLTVKDGDDLGERLDHLRRSLQKLNKRRAHEPHSWSCWHGIAGAVWSYEVKRGRGSGLWHPHVHMVVMSESPISAAALSSEWRDVTGDSYIVDVHAVHGDPAEAFCEVFKYAVKFSDMEPADLLHAWGELRGKRLLGCSGVFFGVEVPESLLDEPLDGLPYFEMFYRFIRGGGYSFVPSSP
jgi:hypothetical protein